MLVTTVTFLTALLVEVIPTSMSCQYTSNRNMEFVNTLCCYDNSNGIYLTTILRHFACVRISYTKFFVMKCVEAHTSIICPFVITAIATEIFCVNGFSLIVLILESLFHSLWRNGIGDSGATALADALTVNQSLTTLK